VPTRCRRSSGTCCTQRARRAVMTRPSRVCSAPALRCGISLRRQRRARSTRTQTVPRAAIPRLGPLRVIAPRACHSAAHVHLTVGLPPMSRAQSERVGSLDCDIRNPMFNDVRALCDLYPVRKQGPRGYVGPAAAPAPHAAQLFRICICVSVCVVGAAAAQVVKSPCVSHTMHRASALARSCVSHTMHRTSALARAIGCDWAL
jgi:hypothetical protein